MPHAISEQLAFSRNGVMLQLEGFFCTRTIEEKWDQVRPGIQVHEGVHSVGQEPGRKHDLLEQEGPMKRWVGPVIGPHKSHFIVLYIINPLKNFNKGSRIHSLKGIMMSRPQGLSLTATLPWPQLFTSILVAILLLPSKHCPDAVMSAGGNKGIRLLTAALSPIGRQNPVPGFHTHTFEPEFMQKPKAKQV